MEDLEKQIEEAAKKYQKDNFGILTPELVTLIYSDGAKSEASKEYWFNTFVDKIIENETFLDFASKCASKKYEVGSKEHIIATMSIKFGMGCSLTKQYWQQGLYTEEKVWEMFQKFNDTKCIFPEKILKQWFNENK